MRNGMAAPCQASKTAATNRLLCSVSCDCDGATSEVAGKSAPELFNETEGVKTMPQSPAKKPLREARCVSHFLYTRNARAWLEGCRTQDKIRALANKHLSCPPLLFPPEASVPRRGMEERAGSDFPEM